MMPRIATAFLLTGLLGGCVQLPAQPDDPAFAPVYVPQAALAPAESGSIYQSGGAISLFTDRRALRVGDVITVFLDESFQSTKSNDTSISKETSTSVDEPTALGQVVRGLASGAGLVTSLGSTTEFDGEAEADQSNSLTGTISVTVSQVMPNGLMVVQGEKWLTLNQGEEYVRISGLIRPEDIAPDNSISSQRVANARIAYGGRGELADSNSIGWFARFFLSPIWAF